MAEGIRFLNWEWARALRYGTDHPVRHLLADYIVLGEENQIGRGKSSASISRLIDTGYEYNYPRRRRCTALGG